MLSRMPGRQASRQALYLRNAVARFAGFYNVYWELGNEMEHSPNDGGSFVRLANALYIPWIREFDPYDLPMGASEERIWRNTGVDTSEIASRRSIRMPTLPIAARITAMAANESIGTRRRGWRSRPDGRDGLADEQAMLRHIAQAHVVFSGGSVAGDDLPCAVVRH
jgi:hypothetical protein